jgi:hypothetical protein
MTILKEKLAAVVEMLFRMTSDGRLRWAPGKGRDCFTVTLNGSRIDCVLGNGEDRLPAVHIVLHDAKGKVVQRFDDNFLEGLEPHDESHPDYWHLMSALHDLARWTSEGVAAVIDGLLECDQPDPATASNVTPIEAAYPFRREVVAR